MIHLKNRYGKQVRSTFVIGTDGTIRHERRGVKVAGHAHAVLDFVSALAQYPAKA